MEENIYKDYTAEQILDINFIKEVLELPDNVKQKFMTQLEERAKELHKKRDFNNIVKSVINQQILETVSKDSNITEFTNPPNRICLRCKNYECTDLGITKPEYDKTTRTFTNTEICSHPLLPVERLVNVDTNTEKVKLAFYKDNHWQYIICERNTIASKSKIINLANTGIEVTEENAKEMIKFLSTLIKTNPDTISFNKAVTHLGWVDDKFVPYDEEYIFDGDRSFEGVYKDIKSKGNYENWKNIMKDLRQKSETLHFIIASSFASVLIKKVKINPFIVHLWRKEWYRKNCSFDDSNECLGKS